MSDTEEEEEAGLVADVGRGAGASSGLGASALASLGVRAWPGREPVSAGSNKSSGSGGEGLKGGEKFEIVNKALHEMSLKTQVQVTSLLKREHLMKAVGRSVTVEFQPGPLGLQLADVGRRVLVTALEPTREGEQGQAERSGKISVGNQVVGVAGRSVLGLGMKELLALIEHSARPLKVEFQPLIIPRLPREGLETIYDRLGEQGVLEEQGAPYEVEFAERLMGINVGECSGMVVVSQFVPGKDGVEPAARRTVGLGDRVTQVSRLLDGQWVPHDARRLDYAEVAGLVREAGRPVRLTFVPTKVVLAPQQPQHPAARRKHSRPGRAEPAPPGAPAPAAHAHAHAPAAAAAAAAPPAPASNVAAQRTCHACGKPGSLKAKFCWACGKKLTPLVDTTAANAQRQEHQLPQQHPQPDFADLEQHSPKGHDAHDLADLVKVKVLPHTNASVRDTATVVGKPAAAPAHAQPQPHAHPQLLNFDDQDEEDLFQTLALDRTKSDDALDLFS